MSTHRDLLIELGTEELPPRALQRLAQSFADGVSAGLAQAGIELGAVHVYATPRRLALWIEAVAQAQAERTEERRGPAVAAAFNSEGVATPAAQGFARSCGVTVEQLERLETDKGAWLVFRALRPGRPTAEWVPQIVAQALKDLPIPKRMRWGSLREAFVRPVHGLVLLFGDTVIEAQMYGVHAGRHTRGHRFHHPQPIYIASPASYAALLASEGWVIADFAARREMIRSQVMAAAQAVGGVAVIDAALLDEVTGLVEWPVAVTGRFEERFLDVPREALISTMQGNQKYFPVVDAQGQLLPHFITVANIESTDPAQVRAGNERVVRPRLSDAAFFWAQDCKQPLEHHLATLKSVVYQDKLGSLYDKVQRVRTLVGLITVDPAIRAHAQRAAALCKCDLMTRMVGEFPELQGVMGGHYARHDGEPDEVATAIAEHYQPRFAGDTLPHSTSGQILAIADRLDTLLGIFGIGQAPSGDKDPFGLRRAALGALRIMVECDLTLDMDGGLPMLLSRAAEQCYSPSLPPDTPQQVFDFIMERLRGYCAEKGGVPPDAFEAVLAVRPVQPCDFYRRTLAVATFRTLPEAASLAAANKRIHNILRQAQEKDFVIGAQVDTALLVESAEGALYDALARLELAVQPHFEAGEYTATMMLLANLRPPVDAFFDTVMVMAEDTAVRGNRLALLKRLNDLFLRVADISRLQHA